MSERLRSLLVAHGALIFLAGMLAGFPFAFHILGRVELWPIPGSLDFQMPGDYRGWRMAHLEGILNGLLLLGVGAAGGLLRSSERAATWAAGSLVVCGWGNVIAAFIGPLSGVRGLSFTGLTWNSLVFLLFMIAIVAVFIGMVLVFRGAWAGYREAQAQAQAQTQTQTPDS
jgi:hypothetical protein